MPGGLRRDIGAANPQVAGKGDTNKDHIDLDVLVVGAGFAGVYLTRRLRDELGLKVKIYEAGHELGGIWHWNCYPGARVDTPVPIYEYSDPEIWKDWTWSEKYPSWEELRKYFAHVETKWNIKKDVSFNTRVVGAQYNSKTHKWEIQTEDGRTAYARYFINAVGFAAKRHFPDWKGLDTFKGEIYHSSFWPEEGVDLRGKRIAVIGTGSTGVQLAQEAGTQGSHCTVFQRTPNLALPMRQRKLTKEEQEEAKKSYPEVYKHRMTTFAGFNMDFLERNTLDDDAETREKVYQDLWDQGGFKFWLATYKDMLFEWPANDEAYNFWAKKTRERVTDPRKRDIVAPLKAPHPFGTKRPSLEQNYYEMINDPKNNVIDTTANPIKELNEKGIITQDGELHEFDLIALATGFDSVTGGMKTMGLKDIYGVDLAERWKTGTFTYLGMTCHGFPNMFFLYGAQGPTAFSNGPSCVELQGEWIVDAIIKARKEGITYLDPTRQAEEEWRELVQDLSAKTLFHSTNSWYMGANIPGKPREQLNFPGGFPLYYEKTHEVLDNNFKGFTFEPPKDVPVGA